MEFQKVIDRRKMVRTFDSRPIEDEKLDRILQNIFSGPSAGFAQGTEVVVLTEKTDREVFFRQWGSDEERKPYQKKWPRLEHAPVILMICANESKYRQRYAEPDKEIIPPNGVIPWWYVDAGMATLLGLLTAVDQDLVATFTGVHSQEYLKKHFNIPQKIDVIGAILLGYQKGKYRPSTSVSRGRRPREEIVHYHSW